MSALAAEPDGVLPRPEGFDLRDYFDGVAAFLDREHMRDAVSFSHRGVRSGADSTLAFNAFDPHLQLWVGACIYFRTRNGKPIV
jgi:hypothetical protein